MPSKIILLAEDNPDDAFIFDIMLKRAALTHSLQTVGDGQLAIDYLSGSGQFADREKYVLPSLLVLDLKMPIKTGFEVLEWVRAQPRFQNLPVVVLSSSDDSADLKRAYNLGATSYFVKSPQLQDVIQYLRGL